jgi:hypothetical protein
VFPGTIVGQWQEKIDKIKPADVNYIWEEIKRTKVKVWNIRIAYCAYHPCLPDNGWTYMTALYIHLWYCSPFRFRLLALLALALLTTL